MSEIYEFILISNPPETKVLSQFSHLLPFKLQHAFALADFGFTSEVQKILDSINKSICKEMPKFNEVVESLSHRVSTLEGISSSSSSGSGWFGGKLARPKFDKIMMQSFNKFVAGDDDVPVPSSEAAEEGGIFKRLASTPANVPQTGLDTSPNYFNSQPYAASQRQPHYQPSEYGGAPIPRTQSFQAVGSVVNGTLSNDSLVTRVQSHTNIPLVSSNFGTHGYDNLRNSSIPSASVGARRQSGADSRPISPDRVSRRSSNAVHEEQSGNPYVPLSRPGSSQGAVKPLSRPFTPESSVPIKSVEASPSRLRESSQTSPKSQRTVTSPSRVYNPYAPGSSSTTTANAYNPYAPQGSSVTSIPKKTAVSPYEVTSKPSSFIPEDTKSDEPANYGYSPYGAIYGGDTTAQITSEPEQSSYEVEDTATKEEPEEISKFSPNEEAEENNNFASYEPPSYGFQAEPISEELTDPESDASFYTPAVAAPVFSAPSAPTYRTQAIPEENEEDEEEEDDLGFANSKRPAADEDEEEEDGDETESKSTDNSKDKGKDSSSDGKKGWFSGWFKKGDDGQPKAIRAKLGDESSFYYDKELKRWVNKKAPLDDTKSSAPPPPPKSSKPSSFAPTSTTSSPGATPSPSDTPPIANERATSAPIKGPLGPPGRPKASPLSGSTSNSDIPKKPTPPSTSGGLDDLLASAPTTRKPLKRNARSRYVDIMAQK